MKIGVLALQGSVVEHLRSLKRLGVDGISVRKAVDLAGLDGLIIPGGESTTLGKLMRLYRIDTAIIRLADAGVPIYGTCAGMILLAREISGGEPAHLGLIDLAVTRNASGRQVDSFEADIPIPVLGGDPFRAIFIRAPFIDQVGPDVDILAEVNGKPVFARQGALLVSSFHPELATDDRVHRLFLEMVAESKTGGTQTVGTKTGGTDTSQ